jgi:hypothetical protein
MGCGKDNAKPLESVLALFNQTGDSKQDQCNLDSLQNWITHTAKHGPHDKDFFVVLKRAMLEHPDPWTRFLALRSISKYPERDDVVDVLIKCVSEYFIEIGDIYFPFEALSYLEQFKPLTFEQYDDVRRVLVKMFQTKSAFEFYSYNGYLTPFENFRRFIPEPEYTILWPEFVRDLAHGDPESFTRVLITLLPYGQIFNETSYIEHTLRSEHLDSAKLTRVYLLHNIDQCESCLSEESTAHDQSQRQSVTNTINRCKYLLASATADEFETAQLVYSELSSTHDLDDYFECANPFW